MYPQFLFILFSFESNHVQFNIPQAPKNLKVSINNNASIASLVSMSLTLDYFITIDAANLHLCDICQVPTFGLTRLITDSRMGGGYGGAYERFVIGCGSQKYYQKVVQSFSAWIKERLDKLSKYLL